MVRARAEDLLEAPETLTQDIAELHIEPLYLLIESTAMARLAKLAKLAKKGQG